jgi:branched-chain amino acid transport system substrate-binding protein
MNSRCNFIIVTTAIAFGLGSAHARAQSNPIVVGQVIDQSGLNAEASRDFVAGARVYFDSMNFTGGISGRKIRLVVRDDGGRVENTLSQTRELIENDHADVLFGYVGDIGIEALLKSTMLKNAGISFFGAASGLAVDSSVNNVYFTRASYAAEAGAIVEQFSPLGIERYAIARARSPFHMAIAAEVARILRAKGLRLTSDTILEIDGRDTSFAASGVFANKPQVVIILADSVTTALFIKAYRPVDSAGWLVALSMTNPGVIMQIVGPEMAYALLVTQVVPPVNSATLPVAIEHRNAMKKFRDEPSSPITFEGYLAAKGLVEAMRLAKGELTRSEITRTLKRLPRIDLGGMRIQFADRNNRGTSYADIAFLRKDGTFLR